MNKRIHYQDHPSRFFLMLARIIGFLITGVFILFMVPEFISILEKQDTFSEFWTFIFYILAIIYGIGFLISFWKVGLGGLIQLITGMAIILFGLLDTKEFGVFFLLIPLLFPAILFLIYWKRSKNF